MGALEAHRHALADAAVAEDHDPAPVGGQVRDPEERFDRALADRVPVLGKLLDRTVVDHQNRQVQAFTKGREADAAARRLLGPAAQPVVRSIEPASEHVAAVVEDQVRFCIEDLVEVLVADRIVLGRLADGLDPVGVEIGDRFGLGRVEVPGRDDPRAAALQGEEQRDRLGLEVDSRADGQALERLGLIELGGDPRQQPALAADPFDPGCHAHASGPRTCWTLIDGPARTARRCRRWRRDRYSRRPAWTAAPASSASRPQSASRTRPRRTGEPPGSGP